MALFARGWWGWAEDGRGGVDEGWWWKLTPSHIILEPQGYDEEDPARGKKGNGTFILRQTYVKETTDARGLLEGGIGNGRQSRVGEIRRWSPRVSLLPETESDCPTVHGWTRDG